MNAKTSAAILMIAATLLIAACSSKLPDLQVRCIVEPAPGKDNQPHEAPSSDFELPPEG